MSDRPYTDNDLQIEAALAHDALMHLPTAEEIATSLSQSYVPHRHEKGDDVVWGEVLDEDGMTEASSRIRELMVPAAPVGRWAVSLGVDGLEPVTDVIDFPSATLNADFARMHFAFHPDVPADTRTHVINRIRNILAANL